MKKIEIKRGDTITINGMPEGYEVVRVGFARQGELYLGSGDENCRVIVREIEEPTPFLIEAGKCYETTNGVIVGPLEPHKKVKGCWSWGELVWREDGSSTRSRHLDIRREVPNPEPPKPLVIEAGKWYWLRNCVIAGPIEPHKKVKGYWSWGELVWREDGSSTQSDTLDLVEEAPNAEPPKPTYIPWTYETCPIGVVVEKKGEKMKAMIHTVFANGATVHGSVKYFSVLLDEWEQLDGTPCGVEVSE
jgi:hypothetical protein